MNKLQYSEYFKKVEFVYNNKCVATFDYRYTLSGVIKTLKDLGYIENNNYSITDKALKFINESNLFYNPIK